MSNSFPPHYWDRKNDPPVGAGPQGSGTIRTKSGRLVDINTGMYTPGPSAATQAANTTRAKTLNARGSNAGRSPVPRPSGAAAPAGTFPSATSTLTGGKDVNVGGVNMTLNVKQLQQQLRKDGYDVKVDGQMGPQTLSALKDYYRPRALKTMSPALAKYLDKGGPLLGTRDPDAWNKKYGTDKTWLTPMLKPHAGPTGSLTPNGDPQYPSNGGGFTPATVDLSDPKAKEQLAAQTKAMPLSLANFGTLIDPSTADAIAGETYDPQIHDQQLALAHDPLDAAQHLADIKSYYGQVLGSQAKAATRDKAAYNAATGSIGDAGKALVASLGGSANTGAGEVAAAGQDAAGTMAAMGAAENQYNNDLLPILQNEKAGMLIDQGNKDTAQQQADQTKLEDLQGARGQAKQAALAQIEGQNNSLDQARASMGLDIRNANNGLAQSAFNNSLALAQAQIAAEMSGLDATYKQAQTAHLNQKATNPFLAASPTVKNNAFNEAMGSLMDSTTHQPLPLTPQQAQARVFGVLRGYGWNPAPGTPSAAFGTNILRTWRGGS